MIDNKMYRKVGLSTYVLWSLFIFYLYTIHRQTKWLHCMANRKAKLNDPALDLKRHMYAAQ